MLLVVVGIAEEIPREQGYRFGRRENPWGGLTRLTDHSPGRELEPVSN